MEDVETNISFRVCCLRLYLDPSVEFSTLSFFFILNASLGSLFSHVNDVDVKGEAGEPGQDGAGGAQGAQPQEADIRL